MLILVISMNNDSMCISFSSYVIRTSAFSKNFQDSQKRELTKRFVLADLIFSLVVKN